MNLKRDISADRPTEIALSLEIIANYRAKTKNPVAKYAATGSSPAF
jgi:hypothetical protein